MDKPNLTDKEKNSLRKAFESLSFDDKITLFSMLIVPVNVVMKVNGYHMIAVVGKLEQKSRTEFEVERDAGTYAQFSLSQVTGFSFAPNNLEHTIYVDLDRVVP